MERPSRPGNGAAVVITEAEKRRFGRKVVGSELFRTVDFEQLDEISLCELSQAVRGARAIFVRRPWRQGKAKGFIGGGGARQVAHGQHNLIERVRSPSAPLPFSLSRLREHWCNGVSSSIIESGVRYKTTWRSPARLR